MIAFALAALLAGPMVTGTSGDIEAGLAACEAIPFNGESTMDMGVHQQQVVACTRKVMDGAVDRLIVPMKKKDPPRFHSWMQLQARFNRWREDACTAESSLAFFDEKSMQFQYGSVFHVLAGVCEGEADAARARFVASLLAGGAAGATKALQSSAAAGAKHRAELREDRDAFHAAIGRKGLEPNTDWPISVPDPKEWEAKVRAETSGADALAADQCKLLDEPVESCARDLADAMLASVKPDIDGD